MARGSGKRDDAPEGGAAAAGARIEEDLRVLRADVAALAEAVRELGVTAAARMRDRAEGASADAVAEAEQALRALRGQVEGVQARLEGEVRESPLVWLAGAAILGVLVGLVLGRRE